LGVGGELAEQITAVTATIAKLRAERDALTAQRGSAAGGAGPIDRGTGQRSAAAIKDDLDKRNLQVASAERELVKILKDAGASQSSARSTELANLVASNAATVAEQRDAVTRLKNLQDNLAASVRLGGDPADRLRLIADIKALNAALNPATAQADVQAKRAQATAARDATSAVRGQLAAVRALAAAEIDRVRITREQEAQTLGLAAVKALDAQIAAQKRLNDERAKAVLSNEEAVVQLEAQVALIGKSADEQQQLADAERARALALKGYTTDQIDRALEAERILRNQVDAAEAWRQSLQSVVGITQSIAGAFGEVGRNVASGIGAAQQLVAALQKAQAAQAAARAAQGTINAGAASQAAGAASFGAGASVVGIAVGVVAMFRSSSEAARKAADAFRDLAVAAKTAVAEYTLSVDGTGLEKTVAGLKKEFDALAQQIAAAGANGFQGIIRQPVRSTTEDLSAQAITAYNKLVAAAIRAAEFADKQAGQELDARRALAQGRTAEAEAMRQQIADERELEAARIAGADATRLAYIAEVQAAEAAAKIRAQLVARASFAGDLRARGQALSGDDRGASLTRLGISQSGELKAAEDLLKAGTITQEMFDELARVLSGELAKAIEDLDKAARDAAKAIEQEKQNKREELAVRALLATGDDAGAALLRREIANRQELEGVTDVVLRAEILRVQGLEALAIALAEAARLEQERVTQNEDITRRMIDAYRVLDPAKAAELEQIREQMCSPRMRG